jgi:CheY-like chemotaxis protein
MSVLVVDDDGAIRESLVAYLEEFGVENVRVAADGREAILLLNQDAPDVMLLDLMMPHVDGFQVLKAIRVGEVSRPGKIIVLSAHMDGAAADQIRTLGADACVGKPFSEWDLKLAIGLA